MSEDFPGRPRRRRLPFFSPFDRELEDYFEEMDRYFEEAFRDIQENVPKDLVRERELPGGGKVREMGPFVYGYSVTVGPDGKPVVREFGNIKPSLLGKEPPIELSEKREPLVDVLDEKDQVRIIAELPGVEKENINLHLEDKSLVISVETPRKYYKKVELPTEVKAESIKANYKNGILEISIKKTGAEKPRGQKIKIE
ncbi:MAG: Hsp20/alpha crystallin family protein [Thaumarchaeota archaeon]|nr:Hsp20/alpha crystallin family protein [Nitrososphaerota archaeon]MCL5318170.1 Hsp20/alpha crystallin family protein [Nitrososphaerota archaeon]